MKFVETESSSTWPIADYPADTSGPADVGGPGDTSLRESDVRSEKKGAAPNPDAAPIETPAIPAESDQTGAANPKRSKKKRHSSGPSVSERLVHKRRRGKRKRSKHRIAFVLGYLAAGAALYWFGVKIYESWY